MYDFDTIIPRRGTAAVKWDARPPFGTDTEGVIPLWVADMDFKAAPFIVDALRKRVEHGSSDTSAYRTAITMPSSAGSPAATAGTWKRTGYFTPPESYRPSPSS